MSRRFLPLAGLLLLLGGLAVAQEKYADPDSPATHAAARKALANAKTLPVAGKTLEIHRRSLDIVGVTRGIDAALKDLGAKVVGQEIKIELAADVLFDFDKSDLRPDAVPSLQRVAEVLKEYPDAPVLIEGHTDSKGTDAYNQKLSENRAVSVKTWLVKNAGADGARITTRGWGEKKPVAPNTKPDGSDDPEGRQKNRRVEITVKKG